MRRKKIYFILLLVLFLSFKSVFALDESSVKRYNIPIGNYPKAIPSLGTYAFNYYTFPADLYEFFDSNGYYNIVYEINGDTSKFGWVVYDISNEKVIRDITIPTRLEKFGNALYYNNNLFVVYGAKDTSTTDQTKSDFATSTVIEVVKYDMNGNIVKELPISGVDTSNVTADNTGVSFKASGTQSPFETGNCVLAVNSSGVIKIIYNFVAYNGHTFSNDLFVRASDLTHLNKRSTMTTSNPYYHVNNIYFASHSFEERVIVGKDDKFVSVDAVDANPRGVYLAVEYNNTLNTFNVFHFREGKDCSLCYNDTFFSLGNIIDVGDGYLLVGSSEKTLSLNYSPEMTFNESRNLFVQKYSYDTNKKTAETIQMLSGSTRFSETSRSSTKNVGDFYLGNGQVKDYGVKWLTSYANDYTSSEVRSLKIDNNRIMIIWQERDVFTNVQGVLAYKNSRYYYMIIDKNGNIVKNKTAISTATPSNIIDYVYKDGYVYWSETSSKNMNIVLNRLDYNSDSSVATIEAVGSTDVTIHVPTSLKVKTNKDVKVIWSTSKSEIATVDENGLVTPVKNGSCTIYASLEGYDSSYRVAFNVTTDIKVSTIQLKEDTYDLIPDGTSMIYFTVLPYSASNRNVRWTIQDPNVVEIVEQGNSYMRVKALSYGLTTITGTAQDGGGTTATITINVYKAAESIRVNSLKIPVGESMKITYTLTPSDSTEPITFKSTNEKIITIDGDVATAVGTGIVMADAYNSAGKHLYRFTIEGVIPITDISLNVESLSLKKGDTFVISGSPLPENNTYGSKLEYTSSNESIATVETYGGKVTALKDGTCTITVTANNGFQKKIRVVVGDAVRGDFSKDGDVTFTDVIVGLRKVFGYISKTDEDITIGDLNSNGDLDFTDIIILLRFVFGYITSI